MTRALSLTCAALVLVGFGGSAMAKPSIAVLGLEVIDPNGTPTAQDTQAAKELSDGLRARAKAGTGPYQLAPGSDKELIDQKLLNNCDNEANGCMAAIGNQLGADILMYGHFEKQGKSYQVTIKVLDVGRKAVLKSSQDMIPVSDASGAPLQGWAKKIYAKLTGDTSSAGTIVVKVSNAERGAILIDGEPKGNFSNGSGTVSGLGEGKVRVGVESEGFRRWEKDVTIKGGGTETVPVELEKGTPGEIVGPVGPEGPEGPGPGPGPGGGGKGMWIAGTIIGGSLVLGGTGWLIYNWRQLDSEIDLQCRNGIIRPGDCPNPTNEMDEGFNKAESDKRGDRYSLHTWLGGGAAILGVAVFSISAYKWMSKGTSKERQSARGRRQKKDRTFIVTPIMSRDGGGATLRLDW
ncbi:MAG TPA: DUF2380 domain-containing protein [Kofleriaceae bacterium]